MGLRLGPDAALGSEPYGVELALLAVLDAGVAAGCGAEELIV
jgi:hypothetical protein